MKKILVKLSSSESDSEVATEEDEEGKMYQLIFDMKMEDEKVNKEEVQTPSSSGRSPVQVTTNDGRAHAILGGRVSTTKKRRRQRDVNLQDGAREKPWRKVGARLSDFFNFGFNEASWVDYCKKQRELRAAKTRLSVPTVRDRSAGSEPRGRRTGATADAAAAAAGFICEEELQKRRSAHRENSSCPASSSSSCAADFRWPIDPPAVMDAKEGLRILNYSQVDLSPETDGSPLNPPSSGLFAFVPPALFRSQETVSSSHLVDSGRSQGLEEPSTPLDQRSRGASSSEGVASDAGRADAAANREPVTRQERRDRHPAGERVRARQNARRRDGRRRSSSHRVNRGFTREGERGERGERGDRGERGERGERHGDRRPRDDDMQNSSCSVSSRRSRRRRSRLRRLTMDAGEEHDAQSEAQRNRKDEETDDETYEEIDHTTPIDQEENVSSRRRRRNRRRRSRLWRLSMDAGEDQSA
ncbi:pre-mRNA 3'-end-processing factor FIP1 [Clinocottus analis]|uniref:pre-mRNA 3'-end-processing factor FIP1 n=1 Tax=Clinocottus analis TaxID=304258 RepID=UPI0035C0DEB2